MEVSRMTGITQTVAGRIYSVVLAPVTAYVVMQVADVFLEAFVPRREAETLRVGHEVIASPTRDGVKFSAPSTFARCCRRRTARPPEPPGPLLLRQFFVEVLKNEMTITLNQGSRFVHRA
jgi:hypothetical protein